MHRWAIAVLLLLGCAVRAVRLDLTGRRRAPAHASALRRRGSAVLRDSADVAYYTDVVLGGHVFSVLVDTGSSDLWVAGNVSGARETGENCSIAYAIGAVEGTIRTATLDAAGYTVPDQAFLQVAADDENAAGTGILGLGAAGASRIAHQLAGSAGRTVLAHIFEQERNPAAEYLTVLLGRAEPPPPFSDELPGVLTIGEVVPGYDAVIQQPRLGAGDAAFMVALDKDGIRGPDGRVISTQRPDGTRMVAVFDTGYSLPQVPKSVADAIYARLPGSQFVDVRGVGPVWVVPCEQEVNVTFAFAGRPFPIHPLDATLDPRTLGLAAPLSDGKPACIGTFQPAALPPTAPYDMILGMAFLRNAYLLLHTGGGGGGGGGGGAYVQLLATTDAGAAHRAFVRARLGGADTTQRLTAGGGRPRAGRIAAAAVGGACAVVLGAAGAVACVRWRRRRARRAECGAAGGRAVC